MPVDAFDRVQLDGTGIDRITEAEVVAVVRDALAHGRGGRILTPNVDILRRAQRDDECRRHLADADLIVADGMPLVWASRLSGSPLPERVAGSSLIHSLSAGLGLDGRSIYVLGGAPATDDSTPDGATRAADKLLAAYPGLRLPARRARRSASTRTRRRTPTSARRSSTPAPTWSSSGWAIPSRSA